MLVESLFSGRGLEFILFLKTPKDSGQDTEKYRVFHSDMGISISAE
jgi:hypothetical protein